MRNRTIVAAVAMTALAAVALVAQAPPAQQAPSTKGMVLKGKAPVNEAVLQVKLPKPNESDLPNGLHLIVLEDHRTPLVSFQLMIPGAGGYYDPAGLQGLASFTAQMMREGTATRNSQQISEQLDRLAAQLAVTTGPSTPEASMSGSSLSQSFPTLFDIAADVLLNPTFSDEELGRFKQRTAAQLMQARSQPMFLAQEMFLRVVYGTDYPGGRLAPTPEALKAVTRAQLADFHKAHYAPDHAVLAIAGDVTTADVQKLAQEKLAAWKKSGAAAPSVNDPPAIGGAKVALVSRPGSVQTNLAVGTQSITRINPDYDILQVMNKVIGGGPTGRLFMHLREDKGYTYGAYSNLSAGRYPGTWLATTEVRTEVTDPALHDLMAEVATMRDTPVPVTDLQIAKRSMVASFALSLESPSQMLNYYITRWQYKLPADYWDKYPERVMAVTAAQVQDAAKKYLEASRVQIVAVGDASKIKDALAKYGTVETYDTEGKKAGTQ